MIDDSSYTWDINTETGETYTAGRYHTCGACEVTGYFDYATLKGYVDEEAFVKEHNQHPDL